MSFTGLCLASVRLIENVTFHEDVEQGLLWNWKKNISKDPFFFPKRNRFGRENKRGPWPVALALTYQPCLRTRLPALSLVVKVALTSAHAQIGGNYPNHQSFPRLCLPRHKPASPVCHSSKTTGINHHLTSKHNVPRVLVACLAPILS